MLTLWHVRKLITRVRLNGSFFVRLVKTFNNFWDTNTLETLNFFQLFSQRCLYSKGTGISCNLVVFRRWQLCVRQTRQTRFLPPLCDPMVRSPSLSAHVLAAGRSHRAAWGLSLAIEGQTALLPTYSGALTVRAKKGRRRSFGLQGELLNDRPSPSRRYTECRFWLKKKRNRKPQPPHSYDGKDPIEI